MRLAKNFNELRAKMSPERKARNAARFKAFLDGFALGGLLATERPSAPTHLFAQEEEEAMSGQQVHRLDTVHTYGGMGNPIRELRCSCGFSYSAIDPATEEMDIQDAFDNHKIDVVLEALGITFEWV